jgi:hypothetical protein
MDSTERTARLREDKAMREEIDERITIKNGHLPHTAIFLLLPVEGVGVLVFLAYVVFHFHDFISQTSAIVAWVLWFLGLSCYVVLAHFTLKVLRSFLDALVSLAHGAADVHQKFIETKQTRARVELLETRDNYVVYRQDGKVIVQSVLAERDSTRQLTAPAHTLPALPAGGALPTNVRYEDVRSQVPRGHILVGIGSAGIETKERAVGACVWIVGLSGTGKTSTTVLRVEERHTDKHKFLGVDPHWFKPDSLTNAIASYAGDFIQPMARTSEEAAAVFKTFLDEFNARKSGRVPKPWQKITLLVDEVGALMDPTTKQEEENAKLLPSIARICGQEARNFEMGGIFISQQATGLAWLRKMALMVIVHQLLMESEKLLACNGDKNAIAEMKSWPIGRTYVYGVGFQDGPRTVQQPYFSVPASDTEQWNYEDTEDAIEGTLEEDAEDTELETEQDTDPLPIDEDLREALEAWRSGATGPRALQRAISCTYYRAQQLCAELVEKGLVEVD